MSEEMANNLTKREFFAAIALMGSCAKPVMWIGSDEDAEILRAKIEALKHEVLKKGGPSDNSPSERVL